VVGGTTVGVVGGTLGRVGVVGTWVAGVDGLAPSGGKRRIRSSTAAGVPRPSRLLVVTQSEPSGARSTVRSRP